MKNIRIFIWKFSFFGGKIFSLFEKACFHNELVFICMPGVTRVRFSLDTLCCKFLLLVLSARLCFLSVASLGQLLLFLLCFVLLYPNLLLSDTLHKLLKTSGDDVKKSQSLPMASRVKSKQTKTDRTHVTNQRKTSNQPTPSNRYTQHMFSRRNKKHIDTLYLKKCSNSLRTINFT